ncbi:IS66 family transposase [Paenibacillus sp. IHBB 10380]|uniref:IS66 family transposase n=1 Tax=Paenibacillus sp. IHBB 10380 TaxID=1566358 RepID=UPI000A568757|nr:transposase [Paenibacillus sp. IHBB 10380]
MTHGPPTFKYVSMIPLERISQIFHDLTGYRPSEVTLLTSMKRMFEVLEPFEDVIRNQLLKALLYMPMKQTCQ